MNNLTEGTDLRKEIAKFQEARSLGRDSFVKGEVGRGWWRGFLRRNEHQIVTKRGERFAIDRSKWTTLANVKQMYDILYNEMVEAKIAKRLEGDKCVYNDRSESQLVSSSGLGKRLTRNLLIHIIFSLLTKPAVTHV